MKVICILLGLIAFSMAVDTEINFNFAGMIPETDRSGSDDGEECDVCPVCPEVPMTVYSEDQIITSSMMDDQQVGDYTARTFITYMDDMPEVIGWEFTRDFNKYVKTFNRETHLQNFGAMHMIPDTPANHPFTGIGVDFNMAGHPPAPFNVAHFDVHFHTAPIETVMSIVPGSCNGAGSVPCDVAAKGADYPAASFLPSNFISTVDTVPFMGVHWLDPAVIAQPFNMVWVFGTYDGEVNFWEPMITLSYVATGDDICKLIDMPLLFGETTCYPTRYCIRQNEDTFSFTLENFVSRVATPYF